MWSKPLYRLRQWALIWKRFTARVEYCVLRIVTNISVIFCLACLLFHIFRVFVSFVRILFTDRARSSWEAAWNIVQVYVSAFWCFMLLNRSGFFSSLTTCAKCRCLNYRVQVQRQYRRLGVEHPRSRNLTKEELLTTGKNIRCSRNSCALDVQKS